MAVRFRTFGRVSLEREGEEVAGPAGQRRRLAVMALLAAAGPAGIAREKVLGLLWGDHPGDRARQLLAESLFVLRGALGKPAIVATSDYLRLAPEVVWTDVGSFQERIAAGEPREAVALYQGPFLDGFYVRDAPDFERWAARERDRLERALGHALESLAGRAAEGGDWAGAAEWWRRLADHDAYSTRVAGRYVEALARAGEAPLAVRFAEEFTRRVCDELGVEPDAAILRLARTPGPTPPPAAARIPAPAPPPPGLAGLPADLELLEVMGEGSVARVYLGREHTLRRLVAVKVLSPALAHDATARARFEREARAAAGIHHPNVAPIYQTGRLAGGAPYLVMPYLPGGTLQHRLRASGALSLDEARRYLGQAAAGLAAAHRLRIVHRDVRPANILHDRDTRRVVLIDFGIAAVLDDPGPADARLTRPGERLGDPSYASPEQLRGGAVTDRADVYSLGVVAFEMLTGRLPFDAATPLQRMRAHATEEPLRVRELRPEVGASLDELVWMCLRKHPDERPLAADVAEEVGA